MSISKDNGSRTYVRVVAIGKQVSLLSEAPILDGHKACHVRVTVDRNTYSGLGISLDNSSVLLAIDAPNIAACCKVGSSIGLSDLRVVGGKLTFERARDRLRLLLEVDSLRSFSDRSVRHALLYILEAHDPDVRRRRLEIFRTVLDAEVI